MEEGLGEGDVYSKIHPINRYGHYIFQIGIYLPKVTGTAKGVLTGY